MTTSCPFLDDPDPDYCDYLTHGECYIMAVPCPMVQRDGATAIQRRCDTVLDVLAPLVRQVHDKLKSKD